MKIRILIYLLLSSTIAGICHSKNDESSKAHIDSLNRLCIRNQDSLMRERPMFSIFKDNYFITGSSFDGGIKKNNTDVKYQISIIERFSRGLSPRGRYMFISYTQKSLWDLYKKSAPFEDTNFNPSIGVGQVLAIKGRTVGELLLQVEHESNGMGDEKSRSWNLVALSGIFDISPRFNIQAKIWYPFWIAKENEDIVHYKGYWQVGGIYTSPNERWRFSTLLTKRGGWDFGTNVTLEGSFKLSKNGNQYLCVQYYNGYAETLLNYKDYSSYLRVGFVMKPSFGNSIL